MGKIKINRYQGCSNLDIAKAILELSEKTINSCGENTQLKELVISLAIMGWNLSLYKSSDEEYLNKIEDKLPKGLSKEYNMIFKNFLLNLIKEKQEKYPDIFKGITSHKLKIENKEIDLIVHALPIKPV